MCLSSLQIAPNWGGSQYAGGQGCHPEEARQAGGVDQQEPQVQQGQLQSPATGKEDSPWQWGRLQYWELGNSSVEKPLGAVSWTWVSSVSWQQRWPTTSGCPWTGTPHSSLPEGDYEEIIMKLEPGSSKQCMGGMRPNGHKWKEERFRLEDSQAVDHIVQSGCVAFSLGDFQGPPRKSPEHPGLISELTQVWAGGWARHLLKSLQTWFFLWKFYTHTGEFPIKCFPIQYHLMVSNKSAEIQDFTSGFGTAFPLTTKINLCISAVSWMNLQSSRILDGRCLFGFGLVFQRANHQDVLLGFVFMLKTYDKC